MPNRPPSRHRNLKLQGLIEAAVSDDKDIARVILRSVYPELRSSLMGCTVYGMFHTIQDMYQGKAFDEILEFVSMLRTGNTSAGVRLSSDVLKGDNWQKDRAVQVAEKMSEGTRGARGCDGIED
ncbi:hypothetical protein Tco_0697914 [Tanacetum coccineum]